MEGLRRRQLLLLTALLLNFDDNVKLFVCNSPSRAANRGRGAGVEARREAHIAVGRAKPVCRVKPDPPQAFQPSLGPGVVGVGRLARGGQQIAAYITRRDRQVAGGGDEDVSVVLADTLAVAQGF